MTDERSARRSNRVLDPEFDRQYPVIVRGQGVWVEDSTGRRFLDAMSGGSMAATLGHGRADLIQVARDQARRVAYIHNERLTNEAQERLAEELIEIAPEGFAKVKFVTGGAEANETAIRMARAYHVERGEPSRWQIISPAQAYHGPTFETLALTGRSGLQTPLEPYLPKHLHIPPATDRLDPTGEASLAALDRALEEAGPENVAAFFMEPISAAALPSYTPPRLFWDGLADRRERHGFLVCFDEVVTGMGRTGAWFAGSDTPLVPDIIATAKGLGAGYAAIGAVLCRADVFDAFAGGSRQFSLGHTWDGAPLPCAVGSAVIEVLRSEGLVERVRDRGAALAAELAAALSEIDIVGNVRGHGYLLGVEYVDPRDGTSLLPANLRVAGRIDQAAFDRGLVTLSTQPTRDGFAGDQSLFAPAFTATDDELAEMLSRFVAAIRAVALEVNGEVAA